MYSALSRASKRKLEIAAQQHNAEKKRDCGIEQGILQNHLELLDLRASEERRRVGIVNHSDSFRFPDRVLESMCATWDSSAADRVSLEQLKSRKLTAPALPSTEQQQCFVEVEKRLTFHSLGQPWWCRYVCAFREHFRSTAIFRGGDDDDEASTIYVVLYAKQQPYVAVFLECQRVDTEAAYACLPELRGAPLPLHLQVFSVGALVHHDGGRVPFTEDHDLFVLHDLHFQGSFLVSHRAAQRFEFFVSPFGSPSNKQATKRPAAVQKPRIDKDMRARLLAEFPWLTDEDLRGLEANRARGRGGGAGGHGGGSAHDADVAVAGPRPDDDAEQLHDIDPEMVVEELAALRLETFGVGSEDDADSYCHIMGGK